MSLQNNLPKILGNYRFDAPISNWFCVNAKADILFKPANCLDLQHFLKNKPKELSVNILGAASNVIISSHGIEGCLIKLGKEFANVQIIQNNGNIFLKVGAANLCVNIANYCKNFGLAGLEFLSGIPGAIGGAIAMNAGCYGSEIANYLHELTAIDEAGNLLIFSNSQCQFAYRKNNLLQKNKLFIIEAIFKVDQSSEQQVSNKISQLQMQREQSQPIRAKTGGSTFKNPPNLKAWQLIDEAGCRGLENGDAKISTKHCNFIINQGNATAQEIVNLGNLVQEKVFAKSSIMLEWEIIKFGRW